MRLPLYLLFSFGFYFRFIYGVSFPGCGVNRWRCGNGRCIYLLGRCDNFPDCLDESDESGCHLLVMCHEGQRSCDSGQCINDKYFCDGIYDCDDGSDEQNCFDTRHRTPALHTTQAPRHWTTLRPATAKGFTNPWLPPGVVSSPRLPRQHPPTTPPSHTKFWFPAMWPTQTTTPQPAAERVCKPVPDTDGFCQEQFRGYFRNPLTCRMFIVCEWGYRFDCTCPPRTRWDAKLLTCLWEYMVPCTIKLTTRYVPIVTQRPTVSTHPPLPPSTVSPITSAMSTTTSLPSTTARPLPVTTTTSTTTRTTTRTTTSPSTTTLPATTTIATTKSIPVPTTFSPIEPWVV